jgi:biotin carboxyl carrier protein
MKMENVIKAPADVSIHKINILVGDNVEKNQTLIEF